MLRKVSDIFPITLSVFQSLSSLHKSDSIRTILLRKLV